MNDTEIAAMVEAYRRVQGAARRWSGKLRRAGYQEAAARLMATTAELGEAMHEYQKRLRERTIAAYRESALLLAAGIEADPLALVVASELRGAVPRERQAGARGAVTPPHTAPDPGRSFAERSGR